MRFSNKVVVVTGASGGIGKDAIRKFVDKGAKVVLVDLNETVIKDVSKELELKKEQFLIIAADVTKEEDVKLFVQHTMEKFGKIDIFFNNAGIEGVVAPITDYPSTQFDLVQNVNVKGVFYGLKHVLRIMKEQKSGVVINTSSIAGLKGSPNVCAYTASKHAVIGLTKAAALEVASMGIRVNAICPSPVNTRMMRSLESGYSPSDPNVAKAKLINKIPLGRYGEVSDVVNLVLFLASENSDFITGVAYPVDGGLNTL